MRLSLCVSLLCAGSCAAAPQQQEPPASVLVPASPQPLPAPAPSASSQLDDSPDAALLFSVGSENRTALNTAREPFASYLNLIHNRLHPVFADQFLASLDSLPAAHPLNDTALVTTVELVLSGLDGTVARMSLVRPSGVTAFDSAVLDAVQRAGPFGTPPRSVCSRDGNVYLHWEFHRNPLFSCSAMNARPYLLTGP